VKTFIGGTGALLALLYAGTAVILTLDVVISVLGGTL